MPSLFLQLLHHSLELLDLLLHLAHRVTERLFLGGRLLTASLLGETTFQGPTTEHQQHCHKKFYRAAVSDAHCQILISRKQCCLKSLQRFLPAHRLLSWRPAEFLSGSWSVQAKNPSVRSCRRVPARSCGQSSTPPRFPFICYSCHTE